MHELRHFADCVEHRVAGPWSAARTAWPRCEVCLAIRDSALVG